VWVADDEPQPWLRGGTYLVARRIRMLIESWDHDNLGDQEGVIGRHKHTGAPLTGRQEFDTPDFSAQGADGEPVIPVDAHIRLAAPEHNAGHHLLRRGTPTPTASTRAPASSTPACSSSPSSATRVASSWPSSAASGPPTRSTNTSSTPAAACSPFHREPDRTGSWPRGSSAEPAPGARQAAVPATVAERVASAGARRHAGLGVRSCTS
jgi:hypothetical protein